MLRLSWCRAPPAGLSWSSDGGHQQVQLIQVLLSLLPDQLPGRSTTTLYTQNYSQHYYFDPVHTELQLVLQQYMYSQCDSAYFSAVCWSIFSVWRLLACLSTPEDKTKVRLFVLVLKPEVENIKGNEVFVRWKQWKELKWQWKQEEWKMLRLQWELKET